MVCWRDSSKRRLIWDNSSTEEENLLGIWGHAAIKFQKYQLNAIYLQVHYRKYDNHILELLFQKKIYI